MRLRRLILNTLPVPLVGIRLYLAKPPPLPSRPHEAEGGRVQGEIGQTNTPLSRCSGQVGAPFPESRREANGVVCELDLLLLSS